MAGNASPARCQALARIARKLIEDQTEQFTAAGELLCQLYSSEYAKSCKPIGEDAPPRQVLFTRLDCARLAAIHGDKRVGFEHMNFESRQLPESRKKSASLVILALILAIDPQANEYIPVSMCPIAALSWEIDDAENDLLARDMIFWVTPGDPENDDPPAEVLDLLERACYSADTGDVFPDELQERIEKPFIHTTHPKANAILSSPPAAESDSSNAGYRKGNWFHKATNGGMYADLLRVAANDGRLLESKKMKGRWIHQIDEVCQQYPEYRNQILNAKETEASVSKAKIS